jgi:hypothetical protein
MTALELFAADTLRALPIVVASVVGCFVVIERILAARALRGDARDLMATLRLTDGPDGLSDIQTFLLASGGRVAAVVGHAVGRADLISHEVVRVTEAAWADEVDRLERPLTLGVVASAAAFMSGLLPLLLSLLELTRPAPDSGGGILLPGASVIVSAFVGCAVGCVLALGIFFARRDLQRLRSEGRTLIPEFVRLLRRFAQGPGGVAEHRRRTAFTDVIPAEDEFFRPKASAGTV